MTTAPLGPPRRGRTALGAVAALVLCLLPFVATSRVSAASTAFDRWPEGALEASARLPLQEGGRVMPLSTYAEIQLLRWNHRKSALDAHKRTVGALEVVLDILFRPEVADTHALFVIDDHAVLDAVGIAHAGKKRRDRYSFSELVPDRADPVEFYRIGEKRRELLGKLDRLKARDSEAKLDRVEEGVVDLAGHLLEYVRLRHFLSFAGSVIDFPTGAPRFTDVIAKGPALLEAAESEPSTGTPGPARETLKAVRARIDFADYLATIPPLASRGDEPVWLTPGAVATAVLEGRTVPSPLVDVLRAYERCADSVTRPADTVAAFGDLENRLTALARARGEGEKVGLEVLLSRHDPFGKALWGYLIAFLLVALTWLWPVKPLRIAAWSLLGATWGIHVAGIVIRCVIRDRPPMSNLYDTTLFIPAFAVLATFVIERMTRRGIAFAMAPLLGAVGMFVSNRYQEINAGDTMHQLVAVLDTNYWLLLHVTCVGIGYSATLLASAFGHAHIGARLFFAGRLRPDTDRALGRMSYGVLCFALMFSLVGTILGGVWANDSWGRFWGWDPKENGALMIVLAQLATLHGRLGGFLKPIGVSIAAVVCGCIVLFSWWGVNLLGIGLHSYGFTEGIWTGLTIAWAIEGMVILAGVVRALLDSGARVTSGPAPGTASLRSTAMPPPLP